MACDFRIPLGMTPEQRKTQVEKAMERLEKALSLGTITVKVGPQGAVSFTGWNDRDGISDTCAYRKLSAMGSWALKQATARAEVMAGRKVDPKVVGAGVHSHDGGNTWHKGH